MGNGFDFRDFVILMPDFSSFYFLNGPFKKDFGMVTFLSKYDLVTTKNLEK